MGRLQDWGQDAYRAEKLHEKVAQTLLGINARLVTLKQQATVNARSLKKRIADRKCLVEKSKKTLSCYR
jgi:hypothetical protein